MKLSQIDNLTIDYQTSLSLKQDAKATILSDAADRGVLVDYSALENDSASDLQEHVDVSDFFQDREINL